MTEQEWLDGIQLQIMVEWLQGRSSDRKLRLFGCACCRRAWHLLTDDRSRRAVEVCERFADGLVDLATLRKAHQAAHDAVEANVETWRDENFTAFDAVRTNAEDEAYESADLAADTLRNYVFADRRDQEERLQIALLREIFGNPFRPLPLLPPAVRAWKDGFIMKLATAIYEELSIPEGHLDNARLAVLGDALEEAGCTDPDLLGHLRQQGAVHVRGCWCLDLLLGKS